MEHQVSPQTAIMHIIAGYWLSRSVYLAARLKLADAIGEGELGLADLAAKTGTHHAALRRLMRALTSHGFFFWNAKTAAMRSRLCRKHCEAGGRAACADSPRPSWGTITTKPGAR
jgi:hypothetical protein